MDQMFAEQAQRHAWLSTAGEQIRRWREEDAAKGEPWEIDSQPKGAGTANNCAGRD
jgi:hypothetical protein